MFKRTKEIDQQNTILLAKNQMLRNERKIIESELKRLEDENDYLEDRLNIIRHELDKEYDMWDTETKIQIITSIIHDYYANF